MRNLDLTAPIQPSVRR